MYRLKSIVLKAKITNEPFFNKMAEDYIRKASKILDAYVNESPENVGGKFFGVVIRDINFDDGTVELENSVWNFNTLDACKFIPENEIEMKDVLVLHSEYCTPDIEPFIEQLRRKGFEHFFYEDELYDCIVLIPFFKVN